MQAPPGAVRLPRRARAPASRAGTCVQRAVEVDPRGVSPQAFQAVELSFFVHENVNHDVDEVHQDPVRDATAFDVFWFATALFEQPFLDRFGDRQGLARGRPMADHEIVGEVAETPEVENEHVFGFFVESRVDDLFQYGFQRGPPSMYNPCR
jgi:hypothetical protein